MQKIFSVAIDGPAGAGKSTVAKAVAKALNAAYLDTGAMYRTMGLYMAEHGHRRPEAIAEAARTPDLRVEFRDGVQRMFLDGEDVTERIRTPEAAATASKVSAVGAVRERLVDLQREIARGQSVVMDGRDIGTVVLPDATVKIYLTASCEVRAKRRFDELTQAGKEIAYEQVLDDIVQRDYNDAHRAVSPMRQADDAVRVDTSEMTRDEVVADIVRRVRTAIEV
mgnify:FL=1